jgi:hypothetical protein
MHDSSHSGLVMLIIQDGEKKHRPSYWAVAYPALKGSGTLVEIDDQKIL